MAESIAPANFSGGNVSGTRRMLHGMPCSPSTLQNARLLRMLRNSGPAQRDDPVPHAHRCAFAGDTPSSTASACKYAGRGRESRRCCGATGSTPVMNDDQATGEIAGYVVRSRPKLPSLARRARFGSSPAAIHCSGEPRIQAVEADDDDALHAGRAERLPPAQRADQRSGTARSAATRRPPGTPGGARRTSPAVRSRLPGRHRRARPRARAAPRRREMGPPERVAHDQVQTGSGDSARFR